MFHRRARNATEGHLFALGPDQLVKLRHARLARDDHDVRLAYRHRKIAELGHIVLHRRIVKQLFQDDRAGNISDDGSVFGGCAESVVSRNDAARSRHIIDDDGRVTGDVFGQMARNET